MTRHLAALLLFLSAGFGVSSMAAAATCSPLPSTSQIQADFDGDGYGDVAVGAPKEDVGDAEMAGIVQVLYGSASGLTAERDRIFSQDTPYVPGEAADFTRWGETMAAGDFDGDGYCDLAVGAPNESVGNESGAGTVTVLYGSSMGLRSAGSDRFSEATLPGSPETHDRFGQGLAAGQFGRGAYDDLAIGVPGEDDGGTSDAGRVHVLYGGPGGLQGDGAQAFDQDSPGVGGVNESADGFGWTLAAGDIGKSGHDELVVGVPDERVGRTFSAGIIQIFYGSPGGLTDDDLTLSQASPGIKGEPGGSFGQSIAIGDFGKSPGLDLAVSAPGRDSSRGAVHVIYCNEGGPTEIDQVWSLSTADVPGDAAAYDHLGYRVAAGNLGRGSQADLAVSIPLSDQAAEDAGALLILYGTGEGIASANATLLTQDDLSAGALYREHWTSGGLLMADTDADGYAGLLVGSVRERISETDPGAFHSLPGSVDGLVPTSAVTWHQDVEGVEGVAEGGDWWGMVSSSDWGLESLLDPPH